MTVAQLTCKFFPLHSHTQTTYNTCTLVSREKTAMPMGSFFFLNHKRKCVGPPLLSKPEKIFIALYWLSYFTKNKQIKSI